MFKNLFKEFAPYEIALIMKDKGFDEQCVMMYVDGKPQIWVGQFGEEDKSGIKNSLWNDSRFVAGPLWQQVFEWVMRSYDVEINFEYGSEYLVLWTAQRIHGGGDGEIYSARKQATEETFNVLKLML